MRLVSYPYLNCAEPLCYGDVTMGAIASQITSLTIVYSIVYSDADQRKHQSSASLAFVRGIHRGPVNRWIPSTNDQRRGKCFHLMMSPCCGNKTDQLFVVWSNTHIHLHLHINGLTHWGRVTHICVVKLTITGSDNGLSPGRRQAIIWTNDGMLLIGPLGTNFSEILIGIQTFSFKKMRLKMSSAKWRPFCLGLNVLMPDYSALAMALLQSCTKPSMYDWNIYN